MGEMVNANELMFFLKGHFETTNSPPTDKAWGILREAVLSASPVEPFIVNSPPMHNPIRDPRIQTPDKFPFTGVAPGNVPPSWMWPETPCTGCKDAQHVPSTISGAHQL